MRVRESTPDSGDKRTSEHYGEVGVTRKPTARSERNSKRGDQGSDATGNERAAPPQMDAQQSANQQSTNPSDQNEWDN
jgi:hypothetical protein